MGDVQFLAQLIEAMNDAYKKLEEAYSKKDIENFEKAKNTLYDLQKEISKILK